MMRPRRGARKVPLRGIYAGARVTRGFDWKSGDQDGGAGVVGLVNQIQGRDGDSSRTVASVRW